MSDNINLQILKGLFKGKNAKEIAKEVNLSHRTIEARIAAMRKKHNAKNTSHLVSILILNHNTINKESVRNFVDKSEELIDFFGTKDEAIEMVLHKIKNIEIEFIFWKNVLIELNL